MKRAYLLIFLTLLADQLTKICIQHFLSPLGSVPLIGNFFKLSLVKNTGAAFGLFSGANTALIFCGLLAIFIIILMRQRFLEGGRESWLMTAFGLFLGGALSNLLDRIRLGYVIDFISISIWPPFNLADIGITMGAILMIVQLLRRDKRRTKLNSNHQIPNAK